MIRRIFGWRDRVTGLAEKHPFLLSLIVMLIVVTPAFVRIQIVADKQRDANTCVASWADQYTARADRITKVNAATTKAQGEYIHALNVALNDAIRQDHAALARDLPAYQKASVDYETASKASKDAAERDPIPDAPKFQCNGGH